MMRQFSQVSPTWYTGATGREVTKLALVENDAEYIHGLEVRIVGQWLMTGSMHTQYGLYYCPLVILQTETGVRPSSVQRALERLKTLSFASYDSLSQWVWVHEMAAWQLDLPLKPTDNRARAAVRWYETLAVNPFLGQYWDRYRDELLTVADKAGAIVTAERRNGQQKGRRSSHSVDGSPPLEGASKGLRSPLSPSQSSRTSPVRANDHAAARGQALLDTLVELFIDLRNRGMTRSESFGVAESEGFSDHRLLTDAWLFSTKQKQKRA